MSLGSADNFTSEPISRVAPSSTVKFFFTLTSPFPVPSVIVASLLTTTLQSSSATFAKLAPLVSGVSLANSTEPLPSKVTLSSTFPSTTTLPFSSTLTVVLGAKFAFSTMKNIF